MWSLHRSKASFDAKSAVEHFGWLSVYAWHAHDPGYLGLICLICPNPPNINETDINQSSDGLYIWLMFHLICNGEFNTLNDLLCIDAHNLGCLGQTCLTCSNLTETLKQV